MTELRENSGVRFSLLFATRKMRRNWLNLLQSYIETNLWRLRKTIYGRTDVEDDEAPKRTLDYRYMLQVGRTRTTVRVLLSMSR